MAEGVQRLAGAATPAGTRRGAESFGAGSRVLGRTALTVSPVGFGAYRITDKSPLHRRALTDALCGGCNLVDTSTNYGDGGSERLIGTTLAHLVQSGQVRREHVVLVSKVGYLQGHNLAAAKAKAKAKAKAGSVPYPEIVEYRDDCWHCIHPDFIVDQLEQSLERLGVEVLDVLLLHNPEYFLLDAVQRGHTDVRAEFDRRCRAAFVCLEALVASGRIGSYGVSSNGFVDPREDPRATSLARMLELAHEVAGAEHRFCVAQMPMNLFELGATQGPTSALSIAAAADVGVLTNRPFNAFARGDGRSRLFRLTDGGEAPTAARSDVVSLLAGVRKLEARWATGLGASLQIEGGSGDASELFVWGRELSQGIDRIESMLQWTQLRHDVIAPHLGKTSAALLGVLTGEPRAEFARWWAEYGTLLHETFTAIEIDLRARRRDTAQRVSAALDPHLPEPWRSLPLSQKAVLTLLSRPVSSVLVGMRRPGYVHDVLALREHPIRLLSAAAASVDFDAVTASLAHIVAD